MNPFVNDANVKRDDTYLDDTATHVSCRWWKIPSWIRPSFEREQLHRNDHATFDHVSTRFREVTGNISRITSNNFECRGEVAQATGTGKWVTVIPCRWFTRRKSRSDTVSPSLARSARWPRQLDVAKRWKELANQEATKRDSCYSFLLLSPPLPCLALPCLALTCPGNVIVRDHRRGSSSDSLPGLTSFEELEPPEILQFRNSNRCWTTFYRSL